MEARRGHWSGRGCRASAGGEGPVSVVHWPAPPGHPPSARGEPGMRVPRGALSTARKAPRKKVKKGCRFLREIAFL